MENKFINFITNINSVIINNETEFESLNEILKRIKNPLCFKSYNHLVSIAKLNNCLIDNTKVIVEYQIGKGYSIGYKSTEESTDWYGIEPYTVTEVVLDNFLEILLEKSVEIDGKMSGIVTLIDLDSNIYGTWDENPVSVNKNTIKLI